MRLLIMTQAVDVKDPIMGFFTRWLEEFARHCGVIVIGQKVGEHPLPPDVTVLSLEKEKGRSTWSQIIRFWRILWSERKHYDAVFVHMTPVWVVLGWPVCLITRKPLYLWYETKRGSYMLTLALMLVKKVFCATEHGLPSRSPKMVVTGHGTDVSVFRPGGERDPHLVATIGRITRIKNLDVVLRAFASLGPAYRLTIGGTTVTEEDKKEWAGLQSLMTELGITDRVTVGVLGRDGVKSLLQRASLFLHAAQGGLDKVVLEAMACGCPVVSTSAAAAAVLPPACVATVKNLGSQARAVLDLPPEQHEALQAELQECVVRRHNLKVVVPKIVEIIAHGYGSTGSR